MRTIASYIIYVITTVTIICYTLGCLAPYISPVKFTLPAYFGLAFPALCIAILVTLFLNLLSRHWRLSIIITLIILTTTGQWSKTIVIPDNASIHNTDQNPPLKIMSYNIGMFLNHKKLNRIIDFIKTTNADIVCLQEFGFYKKTFTQHDILNALDSIYPYHHIWYKNQSQQINSGLATLSKYPIIKKQKIQYRSANNISIYSDIVVKSDTIRVINNHLESNHLNQSDRNLAALLDDDTSREEIMRHSQKLQTKLGSAMKIRALQAEAIRYTISKTHHKLIVAGDFNDVPQSYSYRIIATGLKDAYTSAGKWGYYWTFNQSLMLFAIDHILISPSIQPINAEIIKTDISDHYPITADICIPLKP